MISVIAKLRSPVPERDLIRAANETRRVAHARGEVTIVLVGDREMKALNSRYRRRRRTTDVLSFAADSQQEVGDVLISIPEARREARRKGIPLRDELRLLVVHGVLHCLGYDHEQPKDARKMLPLQEKILKKEK